MNMGGDQPALYIKSTEIHERVIELSESVLWEAAVTPDNLRLPDALVPIGRPCRALTTEPRLATEKNGPGRPQPGNGSRFIAIDYVEKLKGWLLK